MVPADFSDLAAKVRGGQHSGHEERRGDIVREVNRKPVANVADFNRKIQQAKGQESILFLIERGRSSLFAAVTPR